jgi:hypothetical protein
LVERAGEILLFFLEINLQKDALKHQAFVLSCHLHSLILYYKIKFKSFMEKMTIHRGLAELKLIDAKIQKQIEQLVPSGWKQKDKKIFNFIDEDDFVKNAQSGYDAVLALIDRKNKIKCAIVRKNAETSVKVNDENMTIADAINFKTLVQFKKQLIVSMRQKHNKNLSDMEKANSTVDQNCQRVLEVTFGKDNVKVQSSDIEAVRKPFMEQNQFILVDPLKIVEKVDELEKAVMTFETEVDAVLSEINAITIIEF